MYISSHGTKFKFLILYVDDILLASSDTGFLYDRSDFCRGFEMTDHYKDTTHGLSGLS